MSNIRDMEKYYDTIIQEDLYSTTGRLKFHLNFLFNNIDFTNKKVLDIGGGNGRYCFYSAFKGAKKTICLEPEDAGSRSGVTDKFERLKKKLNVFDVFLESRKIQDYDSGDDKFDIILMYDSINHLHEEACINLLEGGKHKDTYEEIFTKLYSMSENGADLIICDCSRYNLYPLIGMPNPIDPGIEWNKHQSPDLWVSMLECAGFSCPKIRWSSFNPLGHVGRVFFGNKMASYFLTSHFCLSMKKLGSSG